MVGLLVILRQVMAVLGRNYPKLRAVFISAGCRLVLFVFGLIIGRFLFVILCDRFMVRGCFGRREHMLNARLGRGRGAR